MLQALVEVLIDTFCGRCGNHYASKGSNHVNENGHEPSVFWENAPHHIASSTTQNERLECTWQDLVLSLVLLRSFKQSNPHSAFPLHLMGDAESSDTHMKGYSKSRGNTNPRPGIEHSLGGLDGAVGSPLDFKDRLHHLMYLVIGGYATNSMVTALSLSNVTDSANDEVEKQAVLAFLEMINDIGAANFGSDSQARLLVLAEEMLSWLAFSSQKLAEITKHCDGSDSFLQVCNRVGHSDATSYSFPPVGFVVTVNLLALRVERVPGLCGYNGVFARSMAFSI